MASAIINLIYIQIKFVKLFYKQNVILAQHTVASYASSEITNEFCVVVVVFANNYTNIFKMFYIHKYCN
jgi:hypothetical protein